MRLIRDYPTTVVDPSVRLALESPAGPDEPDHLIIATGLRKQPLRHHQHHHNHNHYHSQNHTGAPRCTTVTGLAGGLVIVRAPRTSCQLPLPHHCVRRQAGSRAGWQGPLCETFAASAF